MSTEYTLEELFDLQMGKTPPRNNPEYWNSADYKWISIGDLSKCGKYISETKEYLSEIAVSESGISLIPENTVVMSFKLSIGKTAITAEPMYSNEAIMSFRDRHVVDLLPDYIYYMFSGRDWDSGTNKAVMGKTLNKATLSKIKIRVHPIEEQKHIISILDKVAAVINARNRELQALDDLIKARFVEMFGDPELNPKGWEKGALKEHADVLVGYPFPSEGYSEEGISIVGGYNLMQGYVLWEDSKHWPEDTGYEQYLLQANDIVMAMDRPWVNGGFKIARIDESHLPALLIQRTACIRSRDLEQEFLHILLDSPRFAEHCNVTGSLVPHISNKDINSFQVILPPMNLQKQFTTFVNLVDKSKVVVQKALDEVQLLFDSLMQQYFG